MMVGLHKVRGERLAVDTVVKSVEKPDHDALEAGVKYAQGSS